MTPDELDAIEALAAAATPGPWYLAWGSGSTFGVRTKDETVVPSRRAISKVVAYRADAAYIAALSPDVVRSLVAAARLGAAWQAAEAAIRVGVDRAISIGQYPEGYERAGEWTALLVYEPQYYGNGPTPAAALLSLAEALRGRK